MSTFLKMVCIYLFLMEKNGLYLDFDFIECYIISYKYRTTLLKYY